jgi:hypothetical protein
MDIKIVVVSRHTWRKCVFRAAARVFPRHTLSLGVFQFGPVSLMVVFFGTEVWALGTRREC